MNKDDLVLEHKVSDTTLRARRDEWIAAGVFEQLKTEATAAFDRIVGLDLSEVSLDGSLHKAPCGGEGTGPNPTDRAKLGWKWSVASEGHGVPIGWVIDGANRNDVRLLIPTIEAVAANGLLADIDTLHLDRGYDYPIVRERLAEFGLTISTCNGAAPKNRARNSPCGSGCAGSSRPPTRGGLLVSVDDHVVEPPDVFEKHLPTKYQDSAPKLKERADGTLAWYYYEHEITNVGLNAVAGRPREEYGIEPTRLDEMRRGLLGRRRAHQGHECRRRPWVALLPVDARVRGADLCLCERR